MRYVSTRDPAGASHRFCDILLAGLAPDGGLYVPARYPQADLATLGRWRRVLAQEGYAALAVEILSLYIDDIPPEDLRDLCERTYTAAAFGSPQIVPVDRLGGQLWLAHVSNGPTAAFKDLAMQLLGNLFEYELDRRGATLNILGATSGDTGSAAEYAMRGKKNLTVFMLIPRGRATPFQQAQMFSLRDPAIVNITVDGVFDTCQDLVKQVAADAEFKERWRIGAVNSINWARLLGQVVYYVASWLRVTDRNTEAVSFCVPSGNFGNIYAGHVARQMGVPIDTLILATNENNVLEEFFRTRVYRVRSAAQTHATSSPSMDISKASNFERFVFDVLGRDGAAVRRAFTEELARSGAIDLSASGAARDLADEFGFVAGASTHTDRIATIGQVHARTGVIVDPHTADGIKVAGDYLRGDLGKSPSTGPVVVLETALPVKFATTIVEALGREPEVPAAFAGIMDLPQHVVELDNDVEALKALIRDTLREQDTVTSTSAQPG